jgi:hypothetical protein
MSAFDSGLAAGGGTPRPIFEKAAPEQPCMAARGARLGWAIADMEIPFACF